MQVAFIIGQSFLSTLCAMRWGTFVFYAAFVVIAVVFVVLFIPETKVRGRRKPLMMMMMMILHLFQPHQADQMFDPDRNGGVLAGCCFLALSRKIINSIAAVM